MVEQERISALMDGEASEEEWEPGLNGVTSSPDHAATWQMYHLIGDVMRGDGPGRPGFSARVSAALAQEPTVLAPPPKRAAAPGRSLRLVALPVAASVAGVAVVAWLAFQGGLSGGDKLAVKEDPVRVQTVSVGTGKPDAAVNEYLMVHQEYSPTGAMHGIASYIRSVSDPER